MSDNDLYRYCFISVLVLTVLGVVGAIYYGKKILTAINDEKPLKQPGDVPGDRTIKS